MCRAVSNQAPKLDRGGGRGASRGSEARRPGEDGRSGRSMQLTGGERKGERLERARGIAAFGLIPAGDGKTTLRLRTFGRHKEWESWLVVRGRARSVAAARHATRSAARHAAPRVRVRRRGATRLQELLSRSCKGLALLLAARLSSTHCGCSVCCREDRRAAREGEGQARRSRSSRGGVNHA